MLEWLFDEKLSLPDLQSGNYIPILNDTQQYALLNTVNSPRHRIVNNLPGTRDFCPLIRKTPKLEQYIASDLLAQNDRTTGEPIPDHISSHWQDVEQLVDGLLSTYNLQMKGEIHPVISAAKIAFGFVFIHPFEDGNGRIHRYIIHHILAKKQFTQQGILFPVSASMLSHIVDYRKVLESYSHPLLDFIEWEETKKHNVEVLNETIDFYRYFDATKQAEFLYDCVDDTIRNIIPEEINYLIKYDEFKRYLDDEFEMPDNVVALLIKFLEQNNGKLSKRAKEKEFANLTEKEVTEIENNYELIMRS